MKWRKRDKNLDRELQFHFEQLVASHIQQGMTEVEARLKARREFGGMEQVKEECRDARPTLWFESTLQDIRFALRTLRKSPALAIAIIGTLALGTGANTAIFSVLNSVLLRPLPYPDPGRLIMASEANKMGPFGTPSYLNYLDWRKLTRTCENLGAVRYSPFIVTGSGDAERLWGRYASASLFSILRATPILGRTFRAEEDAPGGAPVALISESLWTRRFARDPTILGRQITLNGSAYSIVGVLPSNFQFPVHWLDLPDDVAVPLGQETDDLMRNRNIHAGLSVIGRLRPRETFQTAGADFAHIGQVLAREYPESNRDLSIVVNALKDSQVYRSRSPLYILMGAVAFVLLIACANVANLLLARSSARRGEIGMRIALGAGRFRIIRQMLTESIVLSLAGGLAGLVLAAIGTTLLVKFAAGNIPRVNEIGMDGRVLGFSLLVALFIGFLFGLAPALQHSRADIRTSGRQIVSGRHGIRDLLVVTEVALALPLLIAGALLIRTLWNLRDVNPGFDPLNVISMQVSLSPTKARSSNAIREAYPELIERVTRLPGVDSAAVLMNPPMSNEDISAPLWIEGTPRPRSPSDLPFVWMYPATPGYLSVMHIPLIRGRFLNEHDDAEHPPVVVIDEAMARALFPNQDPIGRRVSWGGPEGGMPSQIIGVVGHVKHGGLDDDATAKIHFQTYISLVQMGDTFLKIAANGGGNLLLRARSNPLDIAETVRKTIIAADSNEAVSNIRFMPDIVSGTLAFRQFLLGLLGTFAAIALLLTSVGIYGVISYSVSQRTREIGIRMALGAKRADILRSIVGQGAALSLAGIVLGVGASVYLTRFLKSLLFGVGGTDPLTFATVAIVLSVVAVSASLLPALRGARADPLASLRCE